MGKDLVASVHAVPLGGIPSTTAPSVISFSHDPTLTATPAPKGSLGLRTDTPGVYVKINTGPMDWEAIGVVPGSFAPSAVWFGTGVDGSLTFDGTSTVLGIVPSGRVYLLTRDIFATSISIIDDGTHSVQVQTAGFRVFVTDTLSVSAISKIDCDGAPGGSAPTSSSGGAGFSNAYYQPNSDGGSGAPTAGGASGDGHALNMATPFFFTAPAVSLGTTRARGQGGAGGNAGASAGGNGGAVFANDFDSVLRPTGGPPAAGGADFVSLLNGNSGSKLTPSTLTWGSGGGGGAGGSGVGGGGGAGGGICFVAARVLAGSGTISANGGNGGNGLTTSTSGGGGGGGGGVVAIVYETNGGTLVIQANGGNGGTGFAGGTSNGDAGGAGQVIKYNLSGDGT